MAKVLWDIIIEPEVTTEYAGTKLGEYFTNPDVRIATELKGRKVFSELFGYDFPELKIGTPPLYYTCASVLGAKVIFPEDTSPWVVGRLIQELDDIKKLRMVEDISNAGYIPYLIQQYEYLKKKSERTGVTPFFSCGNSESPFGVAILLRGTEIFYDIISHPREIKELLDVITETQFRIIRFEEEFTGEKKESYGGSDDYGGLLSPERYEEFNFPYLKRIYETYGRKERFIHTETFGRGHLRFLRELGITQYDAWPYHNLTARDVVEELPGIFFTWNCTTGDLLSLTPEEIKNKFRKAVTDGAPGMNLDLCARGIPKENIKAFIEVAGEFSER